MKKFLMSVVALVAMAGAVAQVNPMSPIPADQDVRVGKLPNGMTYYLRHNEKPKGQADFYILHDVGAIQEEDNQQGLAHFLEHMAFNGTKNLPGKQLTEYLETIGVKFGYNLNASTGYDRTLYLIKDVPTKREGIVDSALLILHDWSHFIALEGDEIDSERGVIMEELRTTDGSNRRAGMEQIKALGKGTRYEERNLIGYLDYLATFDHEALRDFYKQWYRPDYQAVVIVGDIDVDQVENKIKTLMSDIPAPAADASQKETIVVPDNEEPIVSVFTDPELQQSRAMLFVKRPALPNEANNLVYREMIDIVDLYMTQMANARLQEMAMQPDAPFLGAATASGDVLEMIPTLNLTVYLAVTKDGGLAEGIEAIYGEMEKVRRFGFTQSEFERAQNDLMRNAERQYANRNDRENGSYVQTYLKAYRQNMPMPDAQTEWELDSMLIQSLNVEAVNGYAQQVITPTNQVFVISAPEKEGIDNPTAEEVLAIRQRVIESELTPYEDNVVKEPLLPEGTVLKGSPVKKTMKNEAYGTTEWTLKNGIKVIVKPTAFKADEVRMEAVAKGGLSRLTDDEFYMGELMSSINEFSGVGKFSSTDLKKQLSGKTASVQPYARNYESRIGGYSSPKDLETMLQLLYLNFTSPRFDKNDYTKLINLLRPQLENAEKNPDYVMQRQAIDAIYGHNPRRQELSIEQIDKFDFEKLPAIYRKLFPNANSFTFLFVGNVDLETLKPLVEKYIGSLPTDKEQMSFVDDKSQPVKGEVTREFAVPMQQPKVSIQYYFSGDMPYTFEDRIALSLLRQALTSRYLISIREEKGGSYGVGVRESMDYLPKNTYDLMIAFDTNEEMADELCQIVLDEIKQIAAEGPKTEDIEKSREFMLKDWNNSLEQNNAWVGYIQNKFAGAGLDPLADYEKALRGVTNADVQAVAKKMLADGNVVKVVMRPEKAE